MEALKGRPEVMNFHVSESEVHGNGLFASKDIKEGDLITRTHVYNWFHRAWVNIKPDCMYNHSIYKANCISVTKETEGRQFQKFIYASKSIKKNVEVLVNFFKDLDLEQPEANWKE